MEPNPADLTITYPDAWIELRHHADGTIRLAVASITGDKLSVTLAPETAAQVAAFLTHPPPPTPEVGHAP